MALFSALAGLVVFSAGNLFLDRKLLWASDVSLDVAHTPVPVVGPAGENLAADPLRQVGFGKNLVHPPNLLGRGGHRAERRTCSIHPALYLKHLTPLAVE